MYKCIWWTICVVFCQRLRAPDIENKHCWHNVNNMLLALFLSHGTSIIVTWLYVIKDTLSSISAWSIFSREKKTRNPHPSLLFHTLKSDQTIYHCIPFFCYRCTFSTRLLSTRIILKSNRIPKCKQWTRLYLPSYTSNRDTLSLYNITFVYRLTGNKYCNTFRKQSSYLKHESRYFRKVRANTENISVAYWA